MPDFISLRDGTEYAKAIPDVIVLPESTTDGKRVAIREVTTRRGDPGWNDALVRWMFLQGYIPIPKPIKKSAKVRVLNKIRAKSGEIE